MSFEQPAFLIALLLVPVAAWLYTRSERRREAAAAAFASPATMPSVAPRRPGWRRHAPMLAYAVALAAVVLALARPEATVAVPDERASVVLAIDGSGSMEATDVDPSRLAAAREAVDGFLGDVPDELRVGAVTVSHRGRSIESPSTDRDEVRRLVNELRPAGGTATGEALGASLRMLEARKRAPSAVVLLSDGRSTHGRNPMPLAREAADRRIPIYTVALGTEGGAITLADGSRRPVPPDAETLDRLAGDSGGPAYTADDRLELEDVYERLGSRIGTRKEKREISALFAATAALLLVGGGAMSLRWFARLP